MPSVCIVGAAAAGLAAAHALAQSVVSCVVLDKSRGVSGRAATRWHDADGPDGAFRWRVDHGAQVFTPEPGSAADRLVRTVVAPEALVEIGLPTIPFDDDGTIRPDRIQQDSAPRLAFRDGYSALGRALISETPGLDLRLSTTVTRLEYGADGWSVEATTLDGDVRLGPFEAVVLTPPAPQAAALVAASGMEEKARERLAGALGAAVYRSQWTVVFAFSEPVELPHGAYALVNAPEENDAGRAPHPVAWLALESAKPNRSPQGAAILVAQTSGDWTAAHYGDERETVVSEARALVEALAGPLPDPLWTDTQRWRYSLPDAAVDASALAGAEALGLFVAGDAVAGKGRVHLALESGLEVARRVAAALG